MLGPGFPVAWLTAIGPLSSTDLWRDEGSRTRAVHTHRVLTAPRSRPDVKIF